jgi:hypothetical protein
VTTTILGSCLVPLTILAFTLPLPLLVRALQLCWLPWLSSTFHNTDVCTEALLLSSACARSAHTACPRRASQPPAVMSPAFAAGAVSLCLGLLVYNWAGIKAAMARQR